jgi:tetratricopeptide (TPR) repeat protein
MVRILRFAIIALLISVGMGLAQTQAPASATGWKGKSKMDGKVIDEAGKPVPAVTVKFVFLSTNDGPPDIVTNAKGEWKLENIAEGMWSLEFWKEGLDPRQVPVQVGGKIKEPTIDLKMTKEGTDPIFAMRTGNAKAQALFEDKKYAESRAIYENLLVRYPSVPQLRQLVARTYLMEKNYPKAIDELQTYLKSVPADNQTKLALANVLFEAGRGDDAWGMFSAFDTTVLRSAQDLEIPGFALLRTKKFAEALKYFQRVVALYPDDPQAYYYRGLTFFQIGATVDKPSTPEAKANLEAAKADLTKFLAMVPDAEKNTSDPNYQNAGGAKKMLAEIK